MQVPNSGFIISKYIILEIMNLIKDYKWDQKPDFQKIKLFNIQDSIIDPIINFKGLKPKF